MAPRKKKKEKRTIEQIDIAISKMREANELSPQDRDSAITTLRETFEPLGFTYHNPDGISLLSFHKCSTEDEFGCYIEYREIGKALNLHRIVFANNSNSSAHPSSIHSSPALNAIKEPHAKN